MSQRIRRRNRLKFYLYWLWTFLPIIGRRFFPPHQVVASPVQKQPDPYRAARQFERMVFRGVPRKIDGFGQ